MIFRYRRKVFEISGVVEGDVIERSIRKFAAFYEFDLLEYIYKLRNVVGGRDRVAIDVGANIGNHSIFFGTFVVPTVISVEPNPAVIPTLERNLQKNLGDYRLVKKGLGEFSGRATVVLPEEHSNNSGMTKLKPGDGKIEITTLDSLVTACKAELGSGSRVSLLKIDVEGMEMSVLRGGVRVLKEDRPEIFVEASTEPEFEKLNEFLEEFQYRAMGCFASTPVYHFRFNPKPKDFIWSFSCKVYLIFWSAIRRFYGRLMGLFRRFM